jgi:hypothetical protein
MVIHSAEAGFRRALELLEAGRSREALTFLSAALEDETRERPGEPNDARYLSYYGLCLCLTRTSVREGLNICRAAAKREDYRPDLWRNVGRVALSAGRRAEAYRAFQRGLRLGAGSAGIRHELRRMGVRRPPVLTFLARGNPLNVLLGKLRAACQRTQPSAANAGEAVPPMTQRTASA